MLFMVGVRLADAIQLGGASPDRSATAKKKYVVLEWLPPEVSR